MRPRGTGASSHRESYGKHRLAGPVFPYNGADGNGAGFLILFPVSGGIMARQNPASQGFKGGDSFCVAPAAEKILPVP